ncbi:hypothetical protein BS47DRAFT_1392039 [Hydnum rufescens UP504]|uniref:FAD dependent oxidoreductase domain-containing protein n=1 Tax=Hydnum rufescens UP504 TaxID=1448309 RepID=A0A9P6DYI2_9AGAM|nr:hypothetical protein BS47DRAFT_1392039 [Hydnum rufescens UP504]
MLTGTALLHLPLFHSHSTFMKNWRQNMMTVPHAEWIADVVGSVDPLGDETMMAQVHPFLMTNALISAAQDSGVNVTIAKAETIVCNEETQEITGVMVVTCGREILTIPTMDVIFAAGPWTGMLKWAVIDYGVHCHVPLARLRMSSPL